MQEVQADKVNNLNVISVILTLLGLTLFAQSDYGMAGEHKDIYFWSEAGWFLKDGGGFF